MTTKTTKTNPHRIQLSAWMRNEGMDEDALVEWAATLDGSCPALCSEGCEVEPDGVCPHNCPSVLIAMGVI